MPSIAFATKLAMRSTRSWTLQRAGFCNKQNGDCPGILTAVCVPLTSNLLRAESPGNVLLPARLTGLPKDPVANVSQIVSLDRRLLAERVGKLQRAKLQLVLAGIDTLLGP
jgi:mRNA-degrading endonuclease toxin of MazEF toxin-antitoxin module